MKRIIIIVLVVGIVSLVFLSGFIGNFGGAGANGSMDVYFLDENGTRVYAPVLPPLGFDAGAGDVVDLVAKATWSVTSTSIADFGPNDFFYITVSIWEISADGPEWDTKIDDEDYSPQQYRDFDTGTHEFKWNLATLLGTIEKTWDLRIKLTTSYSATDDWGNVFSEDDYLLDAKGYSVTYTADAGTFSVSGAFLP